MPAGKKFGDLVDPYFQSTAEGEIETPMPDEMEPLDVDISPEAVCYRDAQQTCGNCSYMGETGECAALRMVVEPGAGCNLFSERGM